MNDNWKIFLVVLLVVSFFGTIILIAVNQNNKISLKWDNTCNNIGSKLGFDLYDATKGDCGWGEKCSFQCKFIDNNGGIVVKNVD